MDTTIVESGSRAARGSVPAGKPMLRGIHHLALNTDDLRMTRDFYVRVVGMPLVHGLRTPPRPAKADPTHGHGQGTAEVYEHQLPSISRREVRRV